MSLKAIGSKDDLMLITANGIIIRTGLDQIRSIGRNTQGVRLIKLKSGDKLVAAEKIEAEEINQFKDKENSDNVPKEQSGQMTRQKAGKKPKQKTKSKTNTKKKGKPQIKTKKTNLKSRKKRKSKR